MTGDGVAVKIAVRQPPWGRFYRSCELVVGCPSVHWGLTRASQRGSVVLMIFRLLSPTSAEVLISKFEYWEYVYLPLPVEEDTEPRPSVVWNI